MVFVTLAVCALARVATYFALAARVPTIVTVDPQPAGA
jgi:hypothetical protein